MDEVDTTRKSVWKTKQPKPKPPAALRRGDFVCFLNAAGQTYNGIIIGDANDPGGLQGYFLVAVMLETEDFNQGFKLTQVPAEILRRYSLRSEVHLLEDMLDHVIQQYGETAPLTLNFL